MMASSSVGKSVEIERCEGPAPLPEIEARAQLDAAKKSANSPSNDRTLIFPACVLLAAKFCFSPSRPDAELVPKTGLPYRRTQPPKRQRVAR
jgi:hypothetical protein